MKKLFLLILLCALFTTSCAPKEGIEVREAWMRAAEQGGNSAVYMVIHNYSATADTLVGVTAGIAEAVEIHQSEMVNDVMQMRMVSSVPLGSGERVEFAPGGLHIMLVNLNEESKVGESIEIILRFQNSADISLSVPVQISADHSEHDD